MQLVLIWYEDVHAALDSCFGISIRVLTLPIFFHSTLVTSIIELIWNSFYRLFGHVVVVCWWCYINSAFICISCWTNGAEFSKLKWLNNVHIVLDFLLSLVNRTFCSQLLTHFMRLILNNADCSTMHDPKLSRRFDMFHHPLLKGWKGVLPYNSCFNYKGGRSENSRVASPKNNPTYHSSKR